jgi:SpoVK/Ycf46/Vps4 family AAA+-type ATPase
MLSRALAHYCGARMLFIKPSDINDKYVGESEKRAKSIFVSATKLASNLICNSLCRILPAASPLVLSS